ncbi:hypothetical protein SCRM01_207 [Synechococcus phage S-CRM01]|uniref:hypothetical protein n=1 Tax=Synechococcus phage S-CRM01 TaxID=1026955 RepID=UPI000209E420|nr:hypothetical protein SCRM01_207 [Synechococcus phage S-CRM01]AEC53153.1 hypothetical protein SCRM01_207 [Synechococcus phage S-CRM01]
MTEQIIGVIQPISFTITYDKQNIDDYLEQCEENKETPTQEGYNLYALSNFECMLEESPKASYFNRSIEQNGYIVTDNSIE